MVSAKARDQMQALADLATRPVADFLTDCALSMIVGGIQTNTLPQLQPGTYQSFRATVGSMPVGLLLCWHIPDLCEDPLFMAFVTQDELVAMESGSRIVPDFTGHA